MNFRLGLYAQALDNRSADHFENEGVVLPDGDPRRSRVVDRCSAVNLNGTSVGDAELNLKMRGTEFLLKVVPPARDEAGRPSPIMCVGYLPTAVEGVEGVANWASEVVAAVERFAVATGRPLDAIELERVGRRMEEVQRARLKKKRAVTLAAGLVLCAALAAAFLLGWKAPPAPPAPRHTNETR